MIRPSTLISHSPAQPHRGDDWRTRAACRDQPGAWDGDATPDDRAHAMTVCLNDCPVLTQCDAFARSIRPDGGVWAGRIIADRSHGNRTPKTQETTA